MKGGDDLIRCLKGWFLRGSSISLDICSWRMVVKKHKSNGSYQKGVGQRAKERALWDGLWRQVRLQWTQNQKTCCRLWSVPCNTCKHLVPEKRNYLVYDCSLKVGYSRVRCEERWRLERKKRVWLLKRRRKRFSGRCGRTCGVGFYF